MITEEEGVEPRRPRVPRQIDNTKTSTIPEGIPKKVKVKLKLRFKAPLLLSLLPSFAVSICDMTA